MECGLFQLKELHDFMDPRGEGPKSPSYEIFKHGLPASVLHYVQQREAPGRYSGSSPQPLMVANFSVLFQSGKLLRKR